MILGFILAPMMEENFRRSLIISRGSWWVFLERPISAVFLALSALLLALVLLPAVANSRNEAFKDG